MMNIQIMKNLATEQGLVYRGGFSVTPSDNVPLQSNGEPASALLVFGQAGPSVWTHFSQSLEYIEAHENPLDSWSRRIGGLLADHLNGELLLPFDGPPHHPFIAWAKRAEDVQNSKLGMLIHPVHGLWHAYRFAISVAMPVDGLNQNPHADSICERCNDQLCLNQCPVSAFDGKQYDVLSCSTYLTQNPEAACHTQGCLARDACPEGKASRYEQPQRQFHMQQFTNAMARQTGITRKV